ncbi:hypothetical protein K6L44_09940 [Gluconacetobacter entanii]|uniref:hypothetical protein n=1 Tax=Gluconacetobacter entanii TaxID=108528 RepID=UPI001C934071|nr:hypothetical protein [Gluconacetobacter entanii]MBY4640300.1 hypothetical protein [Gluconacetobacter entanii]MCW4579926.1 hypothetical protein [Gluconacetobacter entanii]MCW4584639.1 hypothetical protein [Gluconacetobacter entanii]MCW4588099.1 hypothetical protein [Gluconacetobacter entanii]
MIGCCIRQPRGPRPGTAALLLVLVALLIATLAGCAHPVIRPLCIPLKAVSKADEIALANELDASPGTPEIHDMARDWVRMRDEDRAACLKKKTS